MSIALRHSARIIAGLVLLGALSACESKNAVSGQRIGGNEPQQGELPRVEVKLPPSPSFNREHAPESYSDGSLSVFGLRNALEEYLEKDVGVTAFVVDVYKCPPCPKGTECKPCDQPHFWIADSKSADRDKSMMVVDLPERDPKTKRPIKLVVGQRYVVNGRFTKSSPSGFKATDGILVYAGHKASGSQ